MGVHIYTTGTVSNILPGYYVVHRKVSNFSMNYPFIKKTSDERQYSPYK